MHASASKVAPTKLDGPIYSEDKQPWHEFEEFSRKWNFEHVTSTPRYPTANFVKEKQRICSPVQKKDISPIFILVCNSSEILHGMAI